MTSTRTVVLDGRVNRVDSVSSADVRTSQFLTRTSMFLKKLTLLRSGRRVSLNDDMDDAVFARNARAVQLGNKAFNMSQPMLGVRMNLDHEDHSDVSPTSCSSPTSGSQKQPDSATSMASCKPFPIIHSDNNVITLTHAPAPAGLPSSSQTASHQAVDGLPSSGALQQAPRRQPVQDVQDVSNPAANEASSARSVAATTSANSGLTDSDSHASSDIFHDAMECDCGQPFCEHTSPARSTASAVLGSTFRAADSSPVAIEEISLSTSLPQIFMSASNSLPHSTQSLPSRNLLSPNALPVVLTSNTGVDASPEITSASPAHSGGSMTPRALHPRLASLPPPMMARYNAQGSARLTPSIVTRPPPMPILNLPTLPPPTPPPPASAAAVSSPMRLRSMPALPHRGPSDIGVEPAEHENADLDDMMDDLEEEEEDEIEEGVASEEEEEEEASSPSVEMEVPSMGRRLRAPLPPSLSRSPRTELPPLATSPFEVTFEGRSGSESTVVPAQIAESSTAAANRVTQYFTPTDPTPPVDLTSHTPLATARRATLQSDYFSVMAQDRPSGPVSAHTDHTRTPRPGDFNDVVPRTVPMPSSSPRPGLYHLGSKSMIDLLSVSRKEKEKEVAVTGNAHEKRLSRAPDYALATTRDLPEHEEGQGPSSVTQDERPTQLRRQRSLPMYTTATEPPPYPSFSPFKPPAAPIVPREEEGKEHLPKYTNSIYLAAIMPRKMEFTAPGFQARDRKWRRALCVLEGTVFKVYKVHGSVVEDWWERTIGVGDRTSVDTGAIGAAGTIRVSAIRESERQLATRPCTMPTKDDTSPVPDEGPAASSSLPAPSSSTSSSRSRLHLAASLLHPSRFSRERNNLLAGNSAASRSRLSMDTGRDEQRSPIATSPRRQSLDSSRSLGPIASASRMSGSSSSDQASMSGVSRASSSATSVSQHSASQTPATSHFSALSSNTSCLEQEPSPKDLVRKYTLQNAESGLASDYLKRKNVIRVRMEGEQFLLQAKDVPAVIDWIEGIQAATNISLDLDDRPMPKGPMFPRRRRRRARRAEGQGQGSDSRATLRASPNLNSNSPVTSRP